MNKNFCNVLYDDILKNYKDSQKYRITASEDEYSNSLLIEYIPAGIKDFIKSINAFSNTSSYIQIILKEPIFKINIKYWKKEKYLAIRVISNVKQIWVNTLDENYHLSTKTATENTVLVHSENAIYSINYNNKYYPASFKSLRNFPDELIAVLAQHFFPKTFLWKDFIKDRFFPPVKITELCEFYNKKDYLEKTFGLCLSKSINKLPLNQSYAACCALKYVKDEQIPLILSYQFDFSGKYNIDKRKRKSIGEKYLYSLMSKRFSDENMLNITEDYIYFSLQMNIKIDVFAGKKKIIKLHDEMAEKVISKANRNSKTKIKESPLKYLKMPKEFVRLKTKEALIAEGKCNHNCVGGYWNYVLEGKSLIYSATIQNEHLTIEIRLRKTRSETKKYNFYISQCYKAHNKPCSPNVLEYVQECLESSSEKAIKEFNTKQISKK